MWKFKYFEVGAGTRVYRSLSFGQQQDQLFKVKYITSSISRRPVSFLWGRVDCAILLITALFSSVFTPKPREDFSTWEPHFPVDVDFRAFFWWFRALQDLKYLYYLCERAGKQIYKCNTMYSRKIKHELLIPRSLSLSTQNRDKLINPFNGHMQLQKVRTF